MREADGVVTAEEAFSQPDQLKQCIRCLSQLVLRSHMSTGISIILSVGLITTSGKLNQMFSLSQCIHFESI